jgi:hypothetical protein
MLCLPLGVDVALMGCALLMGVATGTSREALPGAVEQEHEVVRVLPFESIASSDPAALLVGPVCPVFVGRPSPPPLFPNSPLYTRLPSHPHA